MENNHLLCAIKASKIHKEITKDLKENNITYEQLTENNRKYETVKRRVDYSKAAREDGFILTDIGKKLKMHHSSIIHLVTHFKP